MQPILDRRQLSRAQTALAELDKYEKPTPVFVGNEAKALYRAEEQRDKVLKQCATKWSKVAGVPKEKFWTRAIPQALFDLLFNYEMGCALIAAEAFLEQFGYIVTRPSLATGGDIVFWRVFNQHGEFIVDLPYKQGGWPSWVSRGGDFVSLLVNVSKDKVVYARTDDTDPGWTAQFSAFADNDDLWRAFYDATTAT